MVRTIEDSVEAKRLNSLLAYFKSYAAWQDKKQSAEKTDEHESCEELRKECEKSWESVVKDDFEYPNVIELSFPSETAYGLFKNGHSLDHCVRYLYWYLIDTLNFFKKHCCIHTAYHKKFTIGDDIARIKNDYDKLKLDVEVVFFKYEKRREIYNLGKSKWDKSYCHAGFMERVECISRDIGDMLKALDEFADLPIDAYLEVAYEHIYEANVKGIYNQFDAIRAAAVKCLSFWKNESGFWDPEIVKEILL